MSWQDKLRRPDCTLCPLHEDAEYVCLMGSGSRKSKIMIVGEAPGAREDETHQAFVGAAGQLLTELLEAVGIERSECYITNAVKCRPPGNRTPTRAEAKVCSTTYLAEEMERLGPALVLSLGNSALQATTGRSGITKHRGKLFRVGSSRVLPTFHPAAALRSPKYLPAIKADFAALARLHRGGSEGEGPAPTRTKIVRTPAQLDWLLRKLEEADEVAFDLETDGFDEWRDGTQIVTAGFSWTPGLGVTLPLAHPESPWKNSYDDVLKRLKPILERARLIAHNGKFDARWLAAAGIFVRVSFDTMLAAHLLDENQSKALEYLVTTLLGIDTWKIDLGHTPPRDQPLKRLAVYQARDADNTLRLKHFLAARLKEEPRLARLFVKLMMPASHALTKVEQGGIYIHRNKLEEGTATVQANLNKLTSYMDKSSGGINYNSPQQVAPWLFEKLGMELIETTRTGAPSTREAVLLQLAKESSYARALLKYRKWQKYSGYLNNWAERIDSRGRIHPSFLLHGTVTGRLSSRSPNLQQVPRDPFMRSMFGAPKGWVFVEADYSQIELRIIAMLANEPTMLHLLNTGQDLHYNTAMQILKKPREAITKDERVIWGKHPNFGLCFGMGPGDPEGVREGGYVTYCTDNGIDMDYATAKSVYDGFHATYSRLRPWYERQRRLAARYLRVTSAMGRVRHLPDMQSTDNKVRAEAERQAINSPVQCLASDICLMSLVRLDRAFDSRVARVVGSIHDAILTQVRADAVDEIAPFIREVMEDMSYLRKVFGTIITVPIRVDVSVGDSWGSGSELPSLRGLQLYGSCDEAVRAGAELYEPSGNRR